MTTNKPTSPAVRATLKDVARAAGVSAKTVSRVINQEKGVSPGKRREIEIVIERLGFQPNRAAQALKGNAPKTLLLLAARPDSLYTLQILTGALSEARKSGYHIIIDEYDLHTPAAAERLADNIATSPVGGIILTPPLCDDPELLDLLAQLGMRTVRISPKSRPDIGEIVAAEEAEGAAAAARHLYEMGHRRVSIILGMNDHAATQLRSIGFLGGWLDAGGDTSEITTVRLEELVARPLGRIASTAENLVDAGMNAADAIFDRPELPSAIFAFNDAVALGLIWGAAARGHSVPQDISIVGFDGNVAASLIRPRLTTIFMPLKLLGETAVRLLTQKDFRAVPLATRLVVGETTRDVSDD